MTESLDPRHAARAQQIAEAIWDKKGDDVVARHVREIAQYTDDMIICTARSDRQAMAIADHVEEALRKQRGEKPIAVEGRRNGHWILLDYGDFVVHVFVRPVRAYYELDRLYADSPRIQLVEPQWLRDERPDPDAIYYSDDDWEVLPTAQEPQDTLDSLD